MPSAKMIGPQTLAIMLLDLNGARLPASSLPLSYSAWVEELEETRLARNDVDLAASADGGPRAPGAGAALFPTRSMARDGGERQR